MSSLDNHKIKTVWFFRICLFLSIFIIALSIKFSKYRENEKDHSAYNNALQHSLALRISLNCGLFISIPMLLELILDKIYLKNKEDLDLIYFERITFVISLIVESFYIMLIPNTSNTIAQTHIASTFTRNCLVLYTCVVGLYRISDNKIWTTRRVYLIFLAACTAYSIAAYRMNMSDAERAQPTAVLWYNILSVLLIITYGVFSVLAVYNGFVLYKKWRTSILDTRDQLVLILMVGLVSFVWPLIAYTMLARDRGLLVKRGAYDLTLNAYLYIVLTLGMVMFPRRLHRYESVHVRLALESKQTVAWYIYNEMRNPLNIVSMGLELLSNSLTTAARKRREGTSICRYPVGTLAPIPEIHHTTTNFSHYLAEEKQRREDDRQLLESITLSCANVVDILDDLLQLEKLNNGEDLELMPYEMQKFVQIVVAPFRIQASKKLINLKLVNKLPLNCSVVADIDYLKMGQVLRNFIDCAIRFTPAKGSVVVMTKLVNGGEIKKNHVYFKDDISGRLRRKLVGMAGLGRSSKSKATIVPTNAVVSSSGSNRINVASSLSGSTRGSVAPSPSSSSNRINVALSSSSSGNRMNPAPQDGLHGVRAADDGGLVRSFSDDLFWNTPQIFIQPSEEDSILSVDSSGAVVKNTRNVENRESMVRISVTDTGAGMSSSAIRQLLNEDVVSHGNKVQGTGWSGFAMKIAKTIVEMHGGRLGVNSNGLGKGSVFYVDIPCDFLKQSRVYDVQSTGKVMAATSGNSQSSAFVGGRGIAYNSGELTPHSELEFALTDVDSNNVLSQTRRKRRKTEPLKRPTHFDIKHILIVDESIVSVHLIRKVLMSLNSNWIVDDVASGKECIDAVSNFFCKQRHMGHYDAIIIDNTMSGMSGPETTNLLRNELDGGLMTAFSDSMRFNGLIIGLSSLTDDVDIEQFMAAGADVVLTKPIDSRKLVEYLRNVSGPPLEMKEDEQ